MSQLVHAAPPLPNVDENQAFLDTVATPRIADLIRPLADGPYDLPQLFPQTSGWGAKKAVKKTTRLIGYLEPSLPGLLYPDEKVSFITRGLLNSLIEQYFLGVISFWINRTVFVLTNYRIILINADRKGRPKQMKWQIPYDQIAKFTHRGLFSPVAVFKLKDGKKFKFVHIPRGDRKHFRPYINDMVSRVGESGFQFPSHSSRDSLCTSCFTPVEPKRFDCEQCEETFIKPIKPAIMSLCLPCLGDFYLGHRVSGAMELAGYMFTWLIVAGILTEQGAAGISGAAIVLLTVHGMDALLTHHVAKKGLIPTSAAWRGR